MDDADQVLALRRSVLAACVLHDIDLVPMETGIALTTLRGREVELTWADVAALTGEEGREQGSEQGRGQDRDDDAAGWRLARTLQALVLLDGPATAEVVQPRLVALPREHADHPGDGWALDRVPGGTLEVGIGLLGLGSDPDEVWPLPPLALRLRLVHEDTMSTWWDEARAHADRMGELLVTRLRTNGPDSTGMRPFGGVDVLSLLAVPGVRAWVAASDGTGMRAVAVPHRNRGWLDPSRIDPAFVGAAWTATDPRLRGMPVPLLVTAEEVGAARPLGDVVAQSLDLPQPWFRRRWSRAAW